MNIRVVHDNRLSHHCPSKSEFPSKIYRKAKGFKRDKVCTSKHAAMKFAGKRSGERERERERERVASGGRRSEGRGAE